MQKYVGVNGEVVFVCIADTCKDCETGFQRGNCINLRAMARVRKVIRKLYPLHNATGRTMPAVLVAE